VRERGVLPNGGHAIAWGVTVLLLAGCHERPAAVDVLGLPWAEIERRARGETVTWAMWQGDPFINAYVQNYVEPRLKREYDITLRTVSGQGNTIVSTLMTERESGKTESALDLVWLNGETFYQLRQIDGLLGPFTGLLPHASLIDFANPFIKYDFQQEVKGYECPWGNVQLAIIYDSKRTPDPPRTRAALLEWARAHPGRFTFDTAFTGMTLLKGWLIEIAGGHEALSGPFDAQKYERFGEKLWDYVNALKPYLWRKGRTFPSGVAQLHQLFASGEVDFTMSNNDGEVDNKVLQGLFPDSARALVFQGGTIQNSHYVGIPKGAVHVAGALVTANLLISPEAQYEKLKPAVWGDGTVLAVSRLSPLWRDRFENVPERRHAPKRSEIQGQALPELSPEYMVRLYEDFRKHVLAS
jgi:putative spermidine/putrescine transport system substrate-binding protein